MALDSAPGRSLSLRLSISRAAEATTGCGALPKCGVRSIALRVRSNGRAGSDRKSATPRRLLSGSAYSTCRIAPTSSACEVFSRSEEHTSELQSLMRISYAVFCLKKKKTHQHYIHKHYTQ